MKKAYIQPSVEVMNISGSDAVMLNISDTEVDTSATGVQLSREEEELFWDEEQGW